MTTLACKSVGFFLLVVLGCYQLSEAMKLGKLECSEKDGLKPDSDLLNLIISKCQPKSGQNETMVAACLIKCMMKQQKAVDKKGKLKVNKAKEVITIFPEQFKDKISDRFQECYKEYNPKLKKEANGCNSWVSFSVCFYQFGRELCPSEKERAEMASRENSTTTASP